MEKNYNYLKNAELAYERLKNIQDENVYVQIKKQFHFAETIEANAEDIDIVTEKMGENYTYKVPVPITKVLPLVYENLNTDTVKEKLLLDGEEYSGKFHLHIDGSIMTEGVHNKDSKDLTIADSEEMDIQANRIGAY